MAAAFGFCLFSIIMITTIPINIGHPVPKNDLVFGQDFLSIFINQDQQQQGKTKNEPDSQFLFSSEEKIIEMNMNNNNPSVPSSIIEDNRYTDNKYQLEIRKNSTLNENQTTENSKIIENEESVKDKLKETDEINKIEPIEQKNIVKYVTSGSKIVFIEDIPEDVELSTPATSTTEKSSTSTTVNTESSGEVKVISVRISSSNTKNEEMAKRRKMTRREQNSPVEFIQMASNKRTKLTAVEQDEIDKQRIANIKDSSLQESLRVQTVVSPPQDYSRTDFLNPSLQSVVVHEQTYPREGNARPRSVSYSSISQSIDISPKDKNLDMLENQNRTFASPVAQLPKVYSEPAKVYSQPAIMYSQAAKVYSEPAKFYSEPAKVYSEPAKIYSEPSKFYSEPAKVYSEPAKNYGEPAKFYSQPAGSLNNVGVTSTTTPSPSSTNKKVIFNLDKLPYDLLNAPAEDSKSNVGAVYSNFHKTHQSSPAIPQYPDLVLSTTEIPRVLLHSSTINSIIDSNDRNEDEISSDKKMQKSEHDPSQEQDPKVGYVVEGRDFRKYRVEEKTSDGFIVGEYGVVSTNDGSLRGVRYTADSNINPNLIYKALMKFLSL